MNLDKQLIEVNMTQYGLKMSIATTYKDMMKRIKKYKSSKRMSPEEKEHLYDSLKSRLLRNKERFIDDPNDAYINYGDTKSYCEDCLSFAALSAALYNTTIVLLSPSRPNPIYETKMPD